MLAHTSPVEVSSHSIVPVIVGAGLVVVYLRAARHQHTATRRWPAARSVSFLLGVVLVVAALVPSWPEDFRSHTVQHLLLGVYAPLGLVFGAPLTLALRTMPVSSARLVGRLTRRPALHALSHPATAALLHVGGLAAVLLTPLYDLAARQPLVHAAVHFHYLAAGYLFAWTIAGPDPLRRRRNTKVRVAVLMIAAGAHAALAKHVYANATDLAPDLGSGARELREGAQLMYYGGDLAEIALAVGVFAAWQRRRSALAKRGGHWISHNGNRQRDVAASWSVS